MDCSSPHSVLEALLATRPESLLEWRGSYPYPQVQSSGLVCDSACFLVKSIHFHKIMLLPLSLCRICYEMLQSLGAKQIIPTSRISTWCPPPQWTSSLSSSWPLQRCLFVAHHTIIVTIARHFWALATPNTQSSQCLPVSR